MYFKTSTGWYRRDLQSVSTLILDGHSLSFAWNTTLLLLVFWVNENDWADKEQYFSETGPIVECRQCWERSKDAVKALIGLPNQNAVEKTILKELKSNSKNYCNAFQKVSILFCVIWKFDMLCHLQQVMYKAVQSNLYIKDTKGKTKMCPFLSSYPFLQVQIYGLYFK